MGRVSEIIVGVKRNCRVKRNWSDLGDFINFVLLRLLILKTAH